MCAQGYTCVPAPKQCFTTPCPQFDCVPVATAATPRSGASVVLGVFAQVGSPGTRTVFVRSAPTATPVFVRTTRTTTPVVIRTTRTTTQTTSPVLVSTTQTTTQTQTTQTQTTQTQTTGPVLAGTTQAITPVP
ncbi:hypothetical protein Psi02_10530 [Planotetraspora silvatica]|uniref:Uncharacterized protein n=2 Tax=Planotetraspora silvatica TaxID=234614 RepID=A0A8J3XKM4_9ACTN|nr:hypothetical protein Psi02_10530 [Planotetraspora silvatica]